MTREELAKALGRIVDRHPHDFEPFEIGVIEEAQDALTPPRPNAHGLEIVANPSAVWGHVRGLAPGALYRVISVANGSFCIEPARDVEGLEQQLRDARASIEAQATTIAKLRGQLERALHDASGDSKHTDAEWKEHIAEQDPVYAAMLAEVVTHPPTLECPDPECMICGIRECPQGEPLHFHHDGCPARCGR